MQREEISWKVTGGEDYEDKSHGSQISYFSSVSTIDDSQSLE